MLVAPLVLAWLPESAAFTAQAARANAEGGPPPTREVLFGDDRAARTVQIWLSFFCTLLVLYFLLNWLPLLIVSRGLTRTQAGITQILFNVGSVAGVLIVGVLTDRLQPRRVVVAIYGTIAVVLFTLAGARDVTWISLAVLLAGMGVVGAQSMLYALATTSYSTQMRGTGVGAAVGVGRFGSIAGPLAAGQLLASGASAASVIGASVAAAAIAALNAWLAQRPAKAA